MISVSYSTTLVNSTSHSLSYRVRSLNLQWVLRL